MLPAGSVLRVTVSLVFLFLCPGAALVRHWPEANWLPRSVLAVAVSTALALLMAEGLIVVGAWSARFALVGLAGVTTGAAMLPRPSSTSPESRRIR
jgi:hypothetical protein